MPPAKLRGWVSGSKVYQDGGRGWLRVADLRGARQLNGHLVEFTILDTPEGIADKISRPTVKRKGYAKITRDLGTYQPKSRDIG